MKDNKTCNHDEFEKINNSLYICKKCSLFGIIKEKTPTETKIKLLSKPYNYNIYNEINIYYLIKNAVNFYINNPYHKKNESIKNIDLYLKYRKKLVKHTYNLCSGIKSTYECYYLSILLMDNVINNLDYIINNYQLDLINTICFIISKKFNEKDILKKETYNQYLTICHSPQKFINPNDLINIEVECLKILNYNLNLPTSLTLLKYIFICGIIFVNEIEENEIKKIYDKSLEILAFCVEQNEIYINFNPIQVSFGIIYLIRKKYNLKKNISKYFDDLFGIKFSYIKECVKVIDQLYYKENYNQKENIKNKSNNINQLNLNNYNKKMVIKKNICRSNNITPKKIYFSPIIKSKKINEAVIKNVEFGSATRLSSLNLDDLDEENDDNIYITNIIIVKSDKKNMYKNFGKIQFFRISKHR